MLTIHCKIWSAGFRMGIWLYDGLTDSRFPFMLLVAWRSRVWGISSNWMRIGSGQYSLQWYLYSGKTRRGWSLRGPLAVLPEERVFGL